MSFPWPSWSEVEASLELPVEFAAPLAETHELPVEFPAPLAETHELPVEASLEPLKETLRAKDDLNNFCLATNAFLSTGGHNFLGFEPHEKANLENSLEYTWEWLSMNQHASKHELKAMLETLEDVVVPIMLKTWGLSVEIPPDSD